MVGLRFFIVFRRLWGSRSGRCLQCPHPCVPVNTNRTRVPTFCREAVGGPCVGASCRAFPFWVPAFTLVFRFSFICFLSYMFVVFIFPYFFYVTIDGRLYLGYSTNTQALRGTCCVVFFVLFHKQLLLALLLPLPHGRRQTKRTHEDYEDDDDDDDPY